MIYTFLGIITAIGAFFFVFLVPLGWRWAYHTIHRVIEIKVKEFIDEKGNEMLNDKMQQDSIYSQLFKTLGIVPLSCMRPPTDGEKKLIGDQLNEIEKYGKKYPNLAQTFSRLLIQGDAYYSIQDYNKAIEFYERALKTQDGKNCEALWKKGNALAGIKKYRQAIRLYEDALEMSPNYFQVLHSYGDALQGLHEYDEAIKYYDKALVIRPENLETFYQKGNALTALGRYKEAIDCYDRVLSSNKFHPWALHSLGDAYYASGNLKKADEAYQKVLDTINIRNGLTWYKRANIQADWGKWKEAVDYYKKAVKYGCDEEHKPILYAKQGYALKKSGQYSETEINELYEKAFDKLEQALREDSLNYNACSIYYNMAVCYAMQENKEDALRHLQRAIDANPIVKVWAKAASYADFKLIKDDKDFQELVGHV